jgi:hypothetical protein
MDWFIGEVIELESHCNMNRELQRTGSGSWKPLCSCLGKTDKCTTKCGPFLYTPMNFLISYIPSPPSNMFSSQLIVAHSSFSNSIPLTPQLSSKYSPTTFPQVIILKPRWRDKPVFPKYQNQIPHDNQKCHILVHLITKSWHHVLQYAYVCFICWKWR